MFNLPNSLTLVRIALIPVLFVLLFFPGKVAAWIAAACFTVASLTDLLDGFFARRYNSVTRVGKFLDPLADKLLVAVCLIMLIPLRGIPAWIVAIIISREIAVTGLRGVAAAEGMVMPADTMGKKKTAFQDVAIICLLIRYDYFSLNFHLIGMGLLVIAMVLGVWSGVEYFWKFFRGIDHDAGGDNALDNPKSGS